MYIWFNLLLFSNGHWVYIDAYETLEQCQTARVEIESEEPGNYYCFPHKVQLTDNCPNEFYPRSEG